MLDCSADTIERNLKRKYKQTFTEYKADRLEQTAIKVKQRMIKQALEGNVTCMIFVLKNISDWNDKQEVSHKGEAKIIIDKMDENL